MERSWNKLGRRKRRREGAVMTTTTGEGMSLSLYLLLLFQKLWKLWDARQSRPSSHYYLLGTHSRLCQGCVRPSRHGNLSPASLYLSPRLHQDCAKTAPRLRQDCANGSKVTLPSTFLGSLNCPTRLLRTALRADNGPLVCLHNGQS